MADAFIIARNPQEDSRLPYLLRLPIDDGLVLKARDTWPRAARVYCHPFEEPWPQDAEIVEETRVRSIRKRGAVLELVLDRPRLDRSRFVFTEVRGRRATFLADAETAQAANPGARIPRARSVSGVVPIAVDTRERYPYRFSGHPVRTERVRSVPATMRCLLTATRSRRSNARRSRTSHRLSRTARSRSSSSGSRNCLLPPSSWRGSTRRCSGWST